jgi:hypothetical protein
MEIGAYEMGCVQFYRVAQNLGEFILHSEKG